LLIRCCKSCREDSQYFFDATNQPNQRKRDWLQLYFPSITKGKSKAAFHHLDAFSWLKIEGVYVRMSDLIPFLAKWEALGDDDDVLDALLRSTMDSTFSLKKAGPIVCSIASLSHGSELGHYTIQDLG
jgi:hypothetical protein